MDKLSIKEVAAHLGKHRTTVYRYIKKGTIPGDIIYEDLNGRKFIYKEDLEGLIKKGQEKS